MSDFFFMLENQLKQCDIAWKSHCVYSKHNRRNAKSHGAEYEKERCRHGGGCKREENDLVENEKDFDRENSSRRAKRYM
jgi:hypothetical protein